MNNSSFFLKQLTLEREMTFHNTVVLRYKIEYPEIHNDEFQYCLDLVNRYWKKRALQYLRYIENTMYPAAVRQYLEAPDSALPYEFIETFTLHMQNICILSLSFDRYEFTGGAHGSTRRSSMTWELKACRELELCQLYRCSGHCQDEVLRQVVSQIRQESSLYFDNYEALARETFDPDSFYCTPEGIVVYFQQYDIAPYSSGIREFLIPYGGCFLSPEIFCGI